MLVKMKVKKNVMIFILVVLLILSIGSTAFFNYYWAKRIGELKTSQKKFDEKVAGIQFIADDFMLKERIEDIFRTKGREYMSGDEMIMCTRVVFWYHKKYSRTIGLTYDLIFAVIDIESKFNPKAKSSAGALGLMQIMPFNFPGWLERHYGLKGLSQKQMLEYAYTAEMNLTLGLERLIELQQGQMSVGHASKEDWKISLSYYNWSTKAVAALMEARKKSDPKASLKYATDIEALRLRYKNSG